LLATPVAELVMTSGGDKRARGGGREREGVGEIREPGAEAERGSS